LIRQSVTVNALVMLVHFSAILTGYGCRADYRRRLSMNRTNAWR
jgi:hypothetical protein